VAVYRADWGSYPGAVWGLVVLSDGQSAVNNGVPPKLCIVLWWVNEYQMPSGVTEPRVESTMRLNDACYKNRFFIVNSYFTRFQLRIPQRYSC
jgi:hypothetical protein